jgi:hypothetical protein
MWQCGALLPSSEHIIDGANDAFSFTVLRRNVGTRHPKKDPFGGEECVRGGVIELTTIVALDGFDGAAKLCRDKRKNATRWKKCQI